MSTSRALYDPRDWVSQAAAARLRGVTRQAISRLVRRGRLRTLMIGGRLLVHRVDLLAFTPRSGTRSSKVRSK